MAGNKDRLGDEYRLNTEAIARKPRLFIQPNDADVWAKLWPSTYRHGLKLTGEAGRSAYKRALSKLWDFVFTGDYGSRMSGHKKPVITWE